VNEQHQPDAVTATRIRLLCVDDHRVVREGIVAMIGRRPDMEVVASAGTGEEAVELFVRHQPDVTLMDLQLPRMSGLETIVSIRKLNPQAHIIVLTAHQGDEDIYQALRAGAATYLLKDSLTDELVTMVREVHAGRRPVPPNVQALLAVRTASAALSPREIEVLEAVGQGMQNKEVAAVLGISEDTVKAHVKRILFKLNVDDRTAAVTVALRRGIIHMPR
jgi:two-component system NarL family response regulator